jgi:integrase
MYRAPPPPPLLPRAEEFKDVILSRGRTPQHAHTTCRHIKELLALVKTMRTPPRDPTHADLKKSEVERALGVLLVQGRSHRTRMSYARSLKSFLRWMGEEDDDLRDPLRALKLTSSDCDRRHTRRPLAVEELYAVVRAAYAGPIYSGITGKERALLYIIAAWTGMRGGTLRKLTVSSFALDKPIPTVRVQGNQSKGRRPYYLVIRPDLGKLLAEHFGQKMPATLAFKMPERTKLVRMLRKDLKAAGVAYCDIEKDDSGVTRRVNVLDFHAFRGTFANTLAMAGKPITCVQELCMHADAQTTMKFYTQARHLDQLETLNALPAIPKLEAS